MILKNLLIKLDFKEKYLLLIKKIKSSIELNQEDIVVAIGIIINPILLKK